MNKAFLVTRLQLQDARKPIGIFYALIIGLSLIAAFSIWHNVGEGAIIGGIDFASAVFVLILGLNSFSTAFRFTLAKNVSRMKFFVGTVQALIIIAAVLATVDTVYGTFLRTLIPYECLQTQLYGTTSPLTVLPWTFALYTALAISGFMITMLYYRSNRLLQMLISLSPLLFYLILVILNYLTDGAAPRALKNLFSTAFGFSTSTPNPYIAVASLLLGAVVVAAISFLLIRRIAFRSQG